MNHKGEHMKLSILVKSAVGLCAWCICISSVYAVEKQFKAQLSSNAISDLCLSTSTDSALAGANVVLGSCNLNRSRWDVVPVNGDKYKIVSMTNGLCLASIDDTIGTGNLVQQVCDNTIDARLWHFNLANEISLGLDFPKIKDGLVTNIVVNNVKNEVDGGVYELKNAAGFRCADVAGGAISAESNVVHWPCSRGFNQHWFVSKGVPETLDKIDFNLLVVNKSVSVIPGKEKTATPEDIKRQRYWAEIVLPKFFHDYTHGRVKLNVHYYESPYALSKISSSEAVSPNEVLEDLDIIVNPGWYDLVAINYFVSNLTSSGLITYDYHNGDFDTGISNTPLGGGLVWFNGNEVVQVNAMVHELLHQFEHYYTRVPSRDKNIPECNGGSFIDCGNDKPAGGSYEANTDGLGGNLALYRDYLNGFVLGGQGGMGETMWDIGYKLRDRSKNFVPGGPFSNFLNQSTCLDLTTPSGVIAKDLNNTNNFATVYNKNLSNNWSGSGFIFDGVDDYLRFGNLVGDDFTISTWIKSSQIFPLASASSGVGLVYAGTKEGEGFELRGVRNTNGVDVISFKAGTSPAIIANVDVTTNAWVHVAVVRNKTTGLASLYINGNFVVSGNAGTQRLNKNPIVKIGSAFPFPTIDGNVSDNDHFKGEMADFCLLNNAVDAAEFAKARKTLITPTGVTTFLTDMIPQSATSGFGTTLGIDKSVGGRPLSIGGKTYSKGFGTHAPSEIVYKLDGKANHFLSDLGVDDEVQHNVTVGYEVYGDGNLLYRSGDISQTAAPVSIDIDVSGVKELRLLTNLGKDDIADTDHADWANARIIKLDPVNAPPVANAGPDKTILVGSTVTFDGKASSDSDGSIVSYKWTVQGGPTLTGVSPSQVFTAVGKFIVTLTVTDNTGATATDVMEVNVQAPNNSDFKRTVVFIYGETKTGQDMFIRGGIDHAQAKAILGLDCSVDKSLCSMPIRHLNFLNKTTAPWKQGDTKLDWQGAEAGQGAGAQGSPLDWTTNLWPASWGPKKLVAVDGHGETPLNLWGSHYWMLDVEMDCKKAVNGWFEVKSFISNGPGWEANIKQPGAPWLSNNHFAQCGKLNVFKRGQNDPVVIKAL